MICSYAWQDSSGTPGWCAGTVPCSKRSRHFPPVGLWCSSLSPSATGSMPSWAAIIHWHRSTNGTLRGPSLFLPRSWVSRHPDHSLSSPLTTGYFCLHRASRGKLRYMSTSWLIWVIKAHWLFGKHCSSNAFYFILFCLTCQCHFNPLNSFLHGPRTISTYQKRFYQYDHKCKSNQDLFQFREKKNWISSQMFRTKYIRQEAETMISPPFTFTDWSLCDIGNRLIQKQDGSNRKQVPVKTVPFLYTSCTHKN